MGLQNLLKSVKICRSYWQKFAATFLCPTVYVGLQTRRGIIFGQLRLVVWKSFFPARLRENCYSCRHEILEIRIDGQCILDPINQSISTYLVPRLHKSGPTRHYKCHHSTRIVNFQFYVSTHKTFAYINRFLFFVFVENQQRRRSYSTM